MVWRVCYMECQGSGIREDLKRSKTVSHGKYWEQSLGAGNSKCSSPKRMSRRFLENTETASVSMAQWKRVVGNEVGERSWGWPDNIGPCRPSQEILVLIWISWKAIGMFWVWKWHCFSFSFFKKTKKHLEFFNIFLNIANILEHIIYHWTPIQITLILNFFGLHILFFC